MPSSEDELSIMTSALTVNPATKPKATATKKPKKPIIADSWEDEASDDGEDEDKDDDEPAPVPSLKPTTSAPIYEIDDYTTSSTSSQPPRAKPGERQLKTDAVARRMIAGALGIRTRSTKEQKEYETSLKKKAQEEKEEKKRLEEEREKAKRDVWGD